MKIEKFQSAPQMTRNGPKTLVNMLKHVFEPFGMVFGKFEIVFWADFGSVRGHTAGLTEAIQ